MSAAKKYVRVELSWLNILINTNLDNAIADVTRYAHYNGKSWSDTRVAHASDEYSAAAHGSYMTARDLVWLVEPTAHTDWPNYYAWRDALVAAMKGDDEGTARAWKDEPKTQTEPGVQP